MTSKNILVIFASLFIATSSMAQETGTCFVLSMKYTEQHPVYANVKARYDNASTAKTNSWGSYTATKTDLDPEVKREKAKLDKITAAMKSAGCYSTEDETTVQSQLK
ncbi:MAG: hypothetical protein IT286_01185 [Proteobacteria bacterium]|nr:hypothetical protein [Pseudomonadota bacterium]